MPEHKQPKIIQRKNPLPNCYYLKSASMTHWKTTREVINDPGAQYEQL